MDLHPIQAEPSEAERSAVDAVLDGEAPGEPSGLAETRARRHLFLPGLHALQGRVGWVSPGGLGYLCRRLGVPPAEGYGVATFYAMLAVRERAPVVAHVCDDLACKLAGADVVAGELERRLGPSGQGAQTTWLRSPCLGQCERAPAALLTVAGEAPHDQSLGRVSADTIASAVAARRAPDVAAAPIPQLGHPGLRLLSRVGRVDPTSLDHYRAHGGYVALRRALDLGPARVLREIAESGLVGRGGALFPTGRKWEAVARAVVRPHYLVCNADESEPGTFKDRVLIEGDPFAVVEAMTIAALATGAEKGFVYLRGEYPVAWQRLAGALEQARARGLLGSDVMGRGLCFDVELRRGAGAYVCGEETALFASIEGFRGEPRSKPPFPVEVGLFGKPTCINNVETLVNALTIVEHGPSAYRAMGTTESPGTRLFCVSGSVERPGVYELSLGTPLTELLALAGAPSRERLSAVLLGGAAGTFLAPDELDLPLCHEAARAAGKSLGSGVVLPFDDTVDLAGIVRRIARFFRDESCGQCVPCRVGTVRQEELVARIVSGAPLGSLPSERALFGELSQVMRDASICGLGQTAASAIGSAIELGLFGPGLPRRGGRS